MAREVFPNVFAFGPGAHCLSDAALAMAAVLYLGPDASVSHSTAARMHGIWDRDDGTIHVVTSERRRPIATESRVVQHRTIHRIGARRAVSDGVPTTDVVRTIVEAGQELSTFQVTHVAFQADFQGLLDQPAVRRMLAERRGEPGTRVVADALRAYEEGSAGTRSRTEDRLVDRLVELQSPVFSVNCRTIEGLRGYEPDIAFPARRLIVEINGDRGHAQPGMPEYDAERRATYTAAGWDVATVLASRIWRELDSVAREVLDLARGARHPQGTSFALR